jgi:hypothetical protein
MDQMMTDTPRPQLYGIERRMCENQVTKGSLPRNTPTARMTQGRAFQDTATEIDNAGS